MFSLYFRACFNELQESYIHLWLILDYTTDLIYYADTFVRARTGQIPDGIYRKDVFVHQLGCTVAQDLASNLVFVPQVT